MESTFYWKFTEVYGRLRGLRRVYVWRKYSAITMLRSHPKTPGVEKLETAWIIRGLYQIAIASVSDLC